MRKEASQNVWTCWCRLERSTYHDGSPTYVGDSAPDLANITARLGTTDLNHLRRGGLRWLAIQDESLTFLRESPEQSILVHAARAAHPLTTIPAATLGHRLVGLAGTPDLDPTTLDGYALPSAGPGTPVDLRVLTTVGQASGSADRTARSQRTDGVTRRHTLAGVVQGLAPCSRSV
jgi:hypothetical protein